MSKNSTIRSLLEQARYENALALPEARMLFSHATGIDRVRQISDPDTDVAPEKAATFLALSQRRQRGEPIAYLLGQREFYGRIFSVSPAVLIPRPETELLVDLALARLPATHHVLDLGTGSGILPITLACEQPGLDLTAVDLSEAALAVASQNAVTLGARVRFIRSDWYSALAGQKFGLIVSNPPYIASGDPHLAEGDLRYEPSMALTDFEDGLRHLRIIVAQAPAHLVKGGWLLMEHGYDQGAACRDLLAMAGFNAVQSWQDLAGIERVSGGQI